MLPGTCRARVPRVPRNPSNFSNGFQEPVLKLPKIGKMIDFIQNKFLVWVKCGIRSVVVFFLGGWGVGRVVIGGDCTSNSLLNFRRGIRPEKSLNRSLSLDMIFSDHHSICINISMENIKSTVNYILGKIKKRIANKYSKCTTYPSQKIF